MGAMRMFTWEMQDKDPCGIIPLESLEIISVPFGKKGFRKYAFIIQPQGGEGNIKACKLVDGNVVTGNHSRFIVSCETEKERESWVTSINASMKMIPFQHLLDQKNFDLAKAAKNSRAAVPSTPRSSGASTSADDADGAPSELIE